jgi:hypothetical protein
MMVEWSFVMHDDRLPRDALSGLLSVEITTATSGSNPDRSLATALQSVGESFRLLII